MSPESQRAQPNLAMIAAVAVGAIAIGGTIRANNGIPVRKVDDLGMSRLMEDYITVLCQAKAIQSAALSISEGGSILISDHALAAERRREAGEAVSRDLAGVYTNLEPENAQILRASASLLQESASHLIETVANEVAVMLARKVMPPESLQHEIDQARSRADEILRDRGRISTQITECNPRATATRSYNGQWEVERPTHNRTGVERRYLAFGRDRINHKAAKRGLE